MRKASKKITRGFLAAALMIPTFSAPVLAEETPSQDAAEYTIYPTPQSIVYSTGSSSLTNDINIVYSDSVDEYTKKHAEDVFGLLGDSATITEGDAAVTGKTNVLIGVEGDDSAAEAYFDTHTISAADLFDKTDAYALEISDGQVVILGVTTDAAFYGLTSLKHIFNQSENGEVRNLRIEDYADVKTRGFIEGYYGNPWSFEDRADLMRFGGDYKLNGYFYAPKDDPKHNSKWRELYTDEELEKHRMLAEAGNESKCYYIYALHPFMSNVINFGNNYQSDLQIIKDKFEQMMGVGVKQFAILADDAGVPGGNPQNYVTLMTDLTNWLKEKQATVPGLKSDMIFCPNDYMGNGSSQQMQTLKGLPDSVSIIETGGRVWGDVSPTFNNTFYQNMGRPAFMWINWPCSDNTKEGLIMGGAEAVLKPNTNPETVDGIVLNPMQQSEPSKQGIFTNADYAWKIWDNEEHYEQVWNDSFAFIDHGTIDETAGSNAYRELSKHMKNSRQIGNSESEEISDMLTAFRAKLTGNQDITAEEIAEVRAEFVKLQDAAKIYREQTGNTRTLDQIVYWIDAWDDTTEAVIGYLDTLQALNENRSVAEIWDLFANAQNSKSASSTHGFHYVDHLEYAQPGRIHITPFMNALDAALSARVLPMINPNIDTKSFITSRSDSPNGSTTNVFDGNASTEIIFQSPNSLEEGDYVGVLYTKARDVNEIQFLLGQHGNLNDTFSSAKVQYSQDGSTWIDVDDTVYTSPQDIHLTGLDLKDVKGIRVIATAAKTNTWLGVREITINGESGSAVDPEPGTTPTSTTTLVSGTSWYSSYTADKTEDNNLSTFGWTNQPAAVGVLLTKTFDTAFAAESIHIANGDGSSSDKLTNYAIEISEDGTTWQRIKEFTSSGTSQDDETIELNGRTIKAMRIYNLAAISNWVKIAEFTAKPVVTGAYDKALITNLTSTNAGVDKSADGLELVSRDDEAISLPAGGYVGFDLGKISKVTELSALAAGSSAEVEVSRNGYEWHTPAAGETEYIRYVRVINKTDAEISVDLDESLKAVREEITGPVLDSDTVGITSSGWASEDSRENGAAFDGNVDTTTEFAVLPAAGTEIIYDLGQTRSISKLEIINQDSAYNYIRDAKIQISMDKENWTDVIEIGDGVENEDDANVTALDSDAGYTANSTYPNKVSKVGTLETPQAARYLRIYFTAGNQNRAVLFNEIFINDGEFVPVPDYAVTTETVYAQGYEYANMFDGDLTTSWKPAGSEAGSMQYDFSDSLDANVLNIISRGEASNAKVSVRAVNADGEIEWRELGVLNHSLSILGANDLTKILSVKIDWDNGSAPEITEIIRYTGTIEESTLDFSQLALAVNTAKASRGQFADVEALDRAISQGQKVLASATDQQSINDAALLVNRALLGMRLTPSKEALDKLN